MARRWFPIWIFPVVLIMAVLTVWVRLTIVRTTYALNQTDKTISNLIQEREKLSVKVAELKSPARLSRLAQEKFKLKRPESKQIVHLRR